MPDFRFLHPIEIRYGDLDPQGVVNNAKYLTYFEQARVHYFVQLGLFDPDQSFLDVGVIVADAHIAYQAPLVWGVPVLAGVRTVKFGTKSSTVEQCVVHAETGKVYASGTVVLVAFDYRRNQSIPVPENWRQKVREFEGME
jgi:acyl-CoA thioester hydrolase